MSTIQFKYDKKKIKLVKLFYNQDSKHGQVMFESRYKSETLSMNTGDFHTHRVDPVRRIAKNFREAEAFESMMVQLEEAEKYNGKEFTGTVQWIDSSRGEGMVKLDDGMTLSVHFSSLDGVKKNNYAYPATDDIQRIESYNGAKVVVKPWLSGHGDYMCEAVRKV